MMAPRFRVVFEYEEERKEVWKFGGTGAEKRAVSLLNSSTRRKTDFKSASMDRHTHAGTWETIAQIAREDK